MLRTILGSDNVYFEPPSSIQMKYPCIVYSLETLYSFKADNQLYHSKRQYQITSITTNPDTDIVEDMEKFFENCSHERRFKSDNLIHDVFRVFF